jgi:hypothetical protein
MIAIPSIPAIAQATLFATHEIGVQIPLRQYLALANPYLDPDLSIYRQRKDIRIVDIHP